MMLRTLTLSSLMLVGQLASAAPARPLIPLIDAAQVAPLCQSGLADLRLRAAAMPALPPEKARDAGVLFAEWNRLQIALQDVEGPFDILSNVSPDKATRSAMEACLVDISQFETDLNQNPVVYAQFKAVTPRDAIETKLRQDVLDRLEDTGAALAPAQQVRLKEILKQLEELGQAFARNVRDNSTQQVFSAQEVTGLPADYLARAKRDDKGNYLLGYATPEYLPFMEYADDANARKRYQAAYTNRGTTANPPMLKEAMALRQELAGLFGLPTYADYVIRRRMAKTPAAVFGFLDEVQAAVTALEKKEIAELRAFKAETLKTALADTRIERWDAGYWQQKLKKARYDVDQNALRAYFPTPAALAWIMDVSARLYGVSFTRVEVPVWHADVQYYDVFDTRSAQRIGGIYLDPFPREGKYGHAAAFGIRGVSTLAQRTPVSVLVTNFNRTGLSSDELETMVHEFGHVLHGVLSQTRYVSQAGTRVERDFVEAPSQMYQEWARRKESLVSLANFCSTPCPVVDDALLSRLTAAHNFGRGLRYGRQLLYARYDMNVYTMKSGDPLAIWNTMEAATPLGHVAGTEFPGQFGHIMGGYSAGYYGYMWSEVLALDMLSAYQNKLMDPVVGQRYRQTILSRGGEVRGADMVREFLGRAPDSKAFFDEISGQRLH
ncbi:M3 family metallopeptidase [Actimicrobium sp. CCC2.4]|uniref:M3 family metallopeptidase n=1 Tax=Actimicrobium sp. CCC2.4 TaxID=3048606 RepID=UPI002AC9E6EE|nr:M3 family metallopeptidase [Actimicrobium sp. CCC2.4]MEB0135352.1 M3 family metallopeptidase [Actimicrobium sp. CCC2.4]WPX32266.1 M3 family metallopeptidase [Actimicrobium sp. CCC2.4]